MNRKTCPNPNYVSAKDGDDCGGGLDEKGYFRLIYNGTRGTIDRHYQDGRIEHGYEPSLDAVTNRNQAPMLREDKPRRFRISEDGTVTEVA